MDHLDVFSHWPGPQLCQWDNHVESPSYPCYARLDAVGCGDGIQWKFVVVILKDFDDFTMIQARCLCNLGAYGVSVAIC